MRPSFLRSVSVKALIISALIMSAVVVAVVYAKTLVHQPERDRHGDDSAINRPALASGGAKTNVSIVTLTEEKLASAQIQVEPATLRSITHHHYVPGRLAYDDNRHIEVKSPTSGIVTEVLVKPGDVVEPGEVLVNLTSPEVGVARADALQRKAQARLSQELAERAAMLKENVTAIVACLKREPDFDDLKGQFAGELLGTYRDQLLGAYARVQLAESMQRNSATLGVSGALSGKTVQERQAEARAARVALDAACEQAGLDVWLEQQRADADARDALRRLEIAQQHLAALLMSDVALHPETNRSTIAEPGTSQGNLEALSTVAVRAPIGGTVEARLLSASERVQAGNTLLVLADTQSLWIEADIRENDWAAVSLSAGQMLTINVPAMNNAEFSATIEYIGREVSTDTNSIAIVAALDNSDGRLRPGLFVRVAIPMTSRSDVLTVPLAAVLRHDSEAFVFAALSANQFRRVDVSTGDEDDGHIEIVSGLRAGDRVVTRGAFFLKSELLLESEEE